MGCTDFPFGGQVAPIQITIYSVKGASMATWYGWAVPRVDDLVTVKSQSYRVMSVCWGKFLDGKGETILDGRNAVSLVVRKVG